MKLRVFYLGLLSTLVMATTQTQAMQKRMIQVPAEHQALKQQVEHTKTDLGETPAHLKGLVGSKQADVNASLVELNADLGGAGNAHDRVKALKKLVEPKTDLTTGIGHTNAHLGVGYQDAADAAAAIAGAHGGAGVIAGAAAGVLEVGLNDADAKAAGAAHAGHAVPNDSATKAANLLARLNTAAAGIGHGNAHNIVYHGPYTSIEAFITAQGW